MAIAKGFGVLCSQPSEAAGNFQEEFDHEPEMERMEKADGQRLLLDCRLQAASDAAYVCLGAVTWGLVPPHMLEIPR